MGDVCATVCAPTPETGSARNTFILTYEYDLSNIIRDDASCFDFLPLRTSSNQSCFKLPNTEYKKPYQCEKSRVFVQFISKE